MPPEAPKTRTGAPGTAQGPDAAGETEPEQADAGRVAGGVDTAAGEAEERGRENDGPAAEGLPYRCPMCQGPLAPSGSFSAHGQPLAFTCLGCGERVDTSLRGSEFLSLDEDQMHLLRIFIACEGRIRDMERALGVSYPTVKSRLAALREQLGFTVAGESSPPAARDRAVDEAANEPKSGDVLRRLEAGDIGGEEALRLLRAEFGESGQSGGAGED